MLTKTQDRNKFSAYTVVIGGMAGIFIESVHTPKAGSIAWFSVVFCISAITLMRLYLFWEGTALNEISKEKARIAAKASLVLTGLLISYGIYLKVINKEFSWHAFGLFIVLQITLSMAEWVLSARIGEKVNTEIQRLRDRLAAAIWRLRKVEAKLKGLEEKAKEAEALAIELKEIKQSTGKVLKKLLAIPPTLGRINGGAFCHCPYCLAEGNLVILKGGSKSTKLVCPKHGKILDVPLNVKAK